AFRVPHTRQVIAEFLDHTTILIVDGLILAFLEFSILLPESLFLSQRLFPVCLQLASYKSILRVRRFITTSRQLGFVVRFLQLQVPLPTSLLASSIQFLQGLQGNLDLGGRDNAQEQLCYGFV